ncbi:MAG: hypothetical protein JRM82_04905 [Nitrososphaerota archaeon]|nr:hypothetical protein [Nitrososphaerota archaeon]
MTETPPRTSAAAFVFTLVLVVAFSVFLVFNEDPWALGRFVVVGVAYLAAIVLSIVWFASPRRRGHAMILLVAALVMLGGVYSLSGGNGYPATNVTNSTSYSCTTFSYTTNSSGYPARGSGFSCTGYNFPVQNVPLALGYNLLAWVPLVGCVLFSMPVWNGRGATKYDNLARLVGGSVPAAAILLNLVGIQSGGSLLQLPVLHLPLNPYVAYGMCDSTTATSGCVYVNQLYVLVDYAFWLGVTILASAAMSEFVSHRMNLGAPLRNSGLYSLALASVLVVGLAVVPASMAASGVLAYPGSSFSFYPNSSFVRIPFVATHSASLSGAFDSNAPLDVYVLNSSQFVSFDQGGGYCPVSSAAPLFVNATRGSMAASVEIGSYSLVFCSPFQAGGASIQVRVTSPVKLSS